MGHVPDPALNRATRRAAARAARRTSDGTAGRARRVTAAAATAGLALAGTTGTLVATAGPAAACGGVNVFNNADSGGGTLRQALATIGDDCSTISFTGVAGQTITLSTPLTINHFVTLDGGLNNVTISGGDTTRIFDLDNAKTGTGTVALKNLTLTHGKVSNSTGAAARFRCASTGIGVVLENMTVTYNTAPDITNGAGLYANGCGDVTVTGSTFSHNTATNGFGGAMLVRNSGNVTITASSFEHNSSQGPGGAIRVGDSGDVTVTGTDFLYNAGGTGSALSLSGVNDVTITGNADGGNFDHNHSEDYGGALALYVAGSVDLTDLNFSHNTAASGGGALYTDATGDVHISGSSFTDNSSFYSVGGAVDAEFDGTHSLTIETSVFSRNEAASAGGSYIGSGGGVFVDGASAVTITGSLFSDDSATFGGGALFVTGAADTTVTVANSTFYANEATYYSAIRVGPGSEPTTLLFDTFADNVGGPAVGVLYSGSPARTVTVAGNVFHGSSLDDLFVDSQQTVTEDHNIFQSVTGFTPGGTDQVGVDPLLGTLSSNGGWILSMPLGAGSPAIDAGPSTWTAFTGDAYDVRGTGYDRVSGAGADIGAFEVQAALPPAPTNLVLSGGSGRSATLTWDAPVSGPTPIGYQVRCMPQGYPTNIGDGGKVVYVGSTATSATIPGLTGGETYVCFVRARYGAQYFSWLGDTDEGPLSASSNAIVVARTVPPAPSRVSASVPPQPSGQATSVTVTEPENRSGADVTRFDVRCTSGDGGTTRTGTAAGPTVGVANLTKGRTYQCVASAVNSVGSSAWSAPSARIVVPAGPVSNVRASATASRTTVSFTRPDGGPTPTRYWVECRSNDGGTTRTGSEVRSPVTLTGLTRGKTYTCRVWAQFDGTSGPVSAASPAFRIP